MAVINDPTTATNIARVGEATSLGGTDAQHATLKPVPTSIGHYRVVARFTLAAAQAAASRVFELRNSSGTNLIVLTRLVVRTIQSVAGTAQVNGFEIFRDLTFTAVDTTNTVTPTVIPKRSGFTAAPASAVVRHVTVAGAAAGMTGGTRTPDASPFFTAPIQVAAAISTVPNVFDVTDDTHNTHPFVFGQDQGFEIQNRVLNVTSYGVDMYIDASWAEVAAF